MNIDNLRAIQAMSKNWTARPFGDRHIFTNGHILCYADGMWPDAVGIFAEREWKTSPEELLQKAIADPLPQPLLFLGIYGTFKNYHRRFQGAGFEYFLNEQYARAFDDNAEFRADGPHKQGVVTEGGIVVAVVMPLQINAAVSFPLVGALPSDVIYHVCQDTERLSY